jgi:hypothetical protein
VAVALEAYARVAAGFAVHAAIGAVQQQAVCLGRAAFAGDGGHQVAVAVRMQLRGAAGAAQAVGVLRAVEQPGSRVASQHGRVGVAVQGLDVVCPANLEAAPGVQAIPLDALIGQRAVGGRAALRGLVQACVAEEFLCAQVACVVAVLGQGLGAATAVVVHADELVLGVPVVAGGGGDDTLGLRLGEAVAVGVVGVAGAGRAADLHEPLDIVATTICQASAHPGHLHK